MTTMRNIQTKYVRSENRSIAYTTVGHGKNVLIINNGWVTNLEEYHNLPGMMEWLNELATFSKIVLFDKRGVGLSDRVNDNQLPDLKKRTQDLRAIIEQEKFEQVTLFGSCCGGPMTLLFAHLFPEKVKSVILYDSFAKWVKDKTYPEGLPMDYHNNNLKLIDSIWGEPLGIELFAPSLKDNAIFKEALASFFRKSASPGAANTLYRMNLAIDIRSILPDIKVPVLVMHREGDRLIPIEMGLYLADRIPGAKWVSLKGIDHLPFVGDSHSVTRSIAKFMGIEYDSVKEVIDEGKLNDEDLRILNEIKSFLDQHFLDDYSIEGLSYQFGINTFKLKYGFKKLFGIPVISYIREKRLKYSAKLLQKTELSVKEIAYKTGYRVPGSFSKAFQQRFDKSPTDIRKLREGVFH
jgi:pimeloyl-ACP methyl ester carboxylesterase/AraC-like DNA-binding protein